jgi:hypothetical protein
MGGSPFFVWNEEPTYVHTYIKPKIVKSESVGQPQQCHGEATQLLPPLSGAGVDRIFTMKGLLVAVVAIKKFRQ